MRWSALPAILAVSLPRPSMAQHVADSARVRPPLVSRRQLRVGVAATGATLVLMRFDRRLQAQFRGRRLQSDDELHTAAKQLSFLGGPGPFWVGASFVAIGGASDATGLVGAGTRITGSVLLAASINALGKGLSGRTVPTATAKHQFSFGRGFHDRNGPFISFPSGHTAAAFALASAVTAEAERSNRPWRRLVRPLSYSVATGVALARVYQNNHWASDLPLGAAIGMWSGSTIESRFGSFNSTLARSSSLSVMPNGRRLTVAAAIRF